MINLAIAYFINYANWLKEESSLNDWPKYQFRIAPAVCMAKHIGNLGKLTKLIQKSRPLQTPELSLVWTNLNHLSQVLYPLLKELLHCDDTKVPQGLLIMQVIVLICIFMNHTLAKKQLMPSMYLNE